MNSLITSEDAHFDCSHITLSPVSMFNTREHNTCHLKVGHSWNWLENESLKAARWYQANKFCPDVSCCNSIRGSLGSGW